MAFKKSMLLLLVVSQQAYSCTYYVGTTVVFSENSAVIEPAEMHLLDAWADKIKKTYPEGKLITLEPSAEPQELEPEKLGRRRELAVRLALIDLHVTAGTVSPSENVYMSPPGGWGSRREQGGKAVSISYLPSDPTFYKPCTRPR